MIEKILNGACKNIDFGDVELDLNKYYPCVDTKLLKIVKIPLSQVITCAESSDSLKGSINIVGMENSVYIGKGVSFKNTKITIKGRRVKLIVANNVRLGGVNISIKNNDSTVIIGSGTTWESGNCICDGGKAVYIGKDCMFSNGVMIRTSDGHGIFDLKSQDLINPPNSVTINEHVWLGNGARVNKGAFIDVNVILANGAIATGVLEKNSVYGGVPAKKIKSDVVWSRTYSLDDIPDKYRGMDVDYVE